MVDKFKGSIAQKNVLFPIETVIEPLAGENYSKGMIFVPLSEAATYLKGIDPAPTDGKLYELTSNNYSDLTQGLLFTWLVPFFKSASAAKIGILVYDDTADTMAENYEKYKMYAYFKFVIGNASYIEANVKLAQLCLPDELYSRIWVGADDPEIITSPALAPEGETPNIVQALNAVKANARVIYHPDTTINAALAQLGRSLSTANSTGTPVGNSIDMVDMATIEPSGELDPETGERANLTSIQCSSLDALHVGYITAVEGITAYVVTEGSLTLQQELVGAAWVKNYIEYICKVQTADYITKMNRYRNNITYQGILTILQSTVQAFVDLGRLSGFIITAPPFRSLPKSGDQFIVPDAWEATYVDNVRGGTVYGKLYMLMPTR